MLGYVGIGYVAEIGLDMMGWVEIGWDTIG